MLPPSAADSLSDRTYTETESILQKFAYIYRYDYRNRCIYKKLPGADPIYMIYDTADHPILSQDGEQRKRIPKEWSFNIPDAFGRTVLTGVISNDSLINTADPLKGIIVKADWAKTTNNYKGYNVSGITLSSPTILDVNYYDSYEFMGFNGVPSITNSDFKPETVTGYDEQYTGGYKGLLTGKITALLDGSGYLYRAMYYDYKGRVIQTKATNHLTGGVEKDYFLNTFTGKIKRHQHIHTALGKATLTEVYINEYDNAERLIKTTHSLNGAAPVTLVENTYDEIGRLQSKTQHGGVETTNYAYNVRGWMKNMISKRFSESLYYNDSSNGSLPCYNGNIGAMNWQLQNDTQRGYNFFYDDLSRITAADYQNNDPTIDKNYSASYTYDKMGNIKTLKRYGLLSKPSTFQAIDDLALNYNGNQLTNIADAVAPGPLYTGTFNFVDSISNKIEYKYDTNGNLTEDLNKKIAKIQYNLLNLPSALQFTEGHTTAYLYDAAGVKRKVKQVTTTENLLVPMGSMLPVPTDKVAVTTQTDYCGNVIYENGTLSRILVDGGYITMSGTTPTYHYYIQDHQGNNRVVFNQSGTVEQTNHFYPFGMTFGEGIDNSDNRYKYNNKELDRMHGLDLYDYGARHYDAAIGRWGVIDPLAEKYYSISPYAYCENNPLNKVDPDGNSSQYNWNTGKYEDESGNEVSWQNVKSEYGIGQTQETSDDKSEDVSSNAATSKKKFKLEGYPQEQGLINVYPEFDLLLLLIPIKSLLVNSSVKAIGTIAGDVTKTVLKPLGRGSTGRVTANSLTEMLAMKEILSDPMLGTVVINEIKDPRWLGWSKMQYTHEALDGTKTVIHYLGKWEKGILKAVDDFKFK